MVRHRRSAPGIRLGYAFDERGQQGDELSHPLFEQLAALREHGSILHAARSLDISYRNLWGAMKRWEEQLGQALVVWSQGQPARLTPFADRLLWAETRARARMAPHIAALRSALERVVDEAQDGSQLVLTVFASHDLALPALRDLAAAGLRLHIELRFCGSVDALDALAAGRCLIAGFHVPALPDGSARYAAVMKPRLKPGLHKLIGCVRRLQGLMVAPGNPLGIHSLADLSRRGLRFVNRQPGSGTRLLVEHLLHEQGLDPARIEGWARDAEHSHVAVAAAVASGIADAGPGVAAAASAFRLGFVPLVEEDYFLVCLKDVLEHPAVLRLRESLASQAWLQQLARLPGYAVSPDGGQVLSLTRALPWWRFPSPKPAHPPTQEGLGLQPGDVSP